MKRKDEIPGQKNDETETNHNHNANISSLEKFEIIDIGTKDANDNKDTAIVTSKTNCLKTLIEHHYRNTPQKRSEEQLESDKYLIRPFINFNRWFLMPAACIPHFCCGSVYAWSVFNKPIDIYINGQEEDIDSNYNYITINSTTNVSGSTSPASLVPITFYIALACLGISGAIFGPWLERNGPRMACLLGTCLFFAGQLVTALALFLKQLWLVFIGYGVIGGFGLGLCYISPVSTLQKWFMDRRGLAGGVAVAGFGSGSIVMSKIQATLIQSVGLPYTFIILGCSYFICMVPAALVLRAPAPDYNAFMNSNSNSKQQQSQEHNNSTATAIVLPVTVGESEDFDKKWTLIEAITSKTFRLLYIIFFSNILFGLVVISRLSNMITDLFEKSVNEAATVVAVNGGFNLLGRLLFSSISDFIGRKNCYVFMLSIQLIILATFTIITSTKTYWAFLICMWTLALCYGGGFATIPSFLTDKFGPSNIGACHGIILTAWSSASILGGLIFTTVFDKIVKNGGGENGGIRDKSDPFPYNVNVWWMLGVVFLGWIAGILVEATKKDKIFINKVKNIFFCIKSN